MKTKNPMQLKAVVNNWAKKEDISPQHALQIYVLERLLVRISDSQYRNQLVVKGGVLVGNLIGVDKRTTMDLDTTITGLSLSHASAIELFEDISRIESEDNLRFKFVRTEEIREADKYQGIRVFLRALYAPLDVPVSVDLSTGDAITPGPKLNEFRLTFSNEVVELMTYPTSVVLAEKLETVLSRGVANTRARDFYDIHALWTMRRDDVSIEELVGAFDSTVDQRGSGDAIALWRQSLQAIPRNAAMQAQWSRFVERFRYVGNLTLEQACDSCAEIMELISRQ